MSNIKVQPLCECKKCGNGIYPSPRMKAYRGKEKVAIKFTCPSCKEMDGKVFTTRYFDHYKRVWEREKDSPPRSEVIGRTMQGFRIDLDTIETVEDLELEWGYGPIPRELSVWPYHQGER